MRSRNALWRITVAAALIGAVAAPAAAQPGKDKKEEQKEKREERKEERENRKEDRKDAREDAKEARQENRAERQEKRQERRKERRAKIKDKWGDLVKRPEAQNELKKHARRIARLNRLLALAEEAKKEDNKKKVEELIEKENKRHEARMAQLNTKGEQK